MLCMIWRARRAEACAASAQQHRGAPFKGSAVGFCDFLDDRQPKSGTTGILRPCPIGPVKPLEEMRKMLRLDPMARILDSHSNPFPNRLQTDGHGSTRRRIVKRIVE